MDAAKSGCRLPTEAEWDYAACGGNQENTANWSYTYAGSNTIGNVAWNEGNAYNPQNGSADYNGAHTVGTKAANGAQLYDMSGNVSELCWDWWNNTVQTVSNPAGPTSGMNRVVRGGNWRIWVYFCEVSTRNSCSPDYQDNGIGFRLVCP
jgi:formylglycine-generating enzyme required for sulfatase activity